MPSTLSSHAGALRYGLSVLDYCAYHGARHRSTSQGPWLSARAFRDRVVAVLPARADQRRGPTESPAAVGTSSRRVAPARPEPTAWPLAPPIRPYSPASPSTPPAPRAAPAPPAALAPPAHPGALALRRHRLPRCCRISPLAAPSPPARVMATLFAGPKWVSECCASPPLSLVRAPHLPRCVFITLRGLNAAPSSPMCVTSPGSSQPASWRTGRCKRTRRRRPVDQRLPHCRPGALSPTVPAAQRPHSLPENSVAPLHVSTNTSAFSARSGATSPERFSRCGSHHRSAVTARCGTQTNRGRCCAHILAHHQVPTGISRAPAPTGAPRPQRFNHS